MTEQTLNKLTEVCDRMPRILGVILYPQGIPIRYIDHLNVRQAYANYLGWKTEETSEPSNEDFNLVRQYCIYHIHAPLWDMNPYYSKSENGKTTLDKLRELSFEIKNWKDYSDYLWKALEIGIDPF